jgi:XTP/dITP diphosphohydrolase
MKIVFATHNPNKVKEIQRLVPDYIELVSLEDLKINEDIPETSGTIAGNAIQKVEYLKQRTDLPIFADDTGLIVNALDGEPGVNSATYAGENRDSKANMDLVLEKLKLHKDRSARFITVIALEINGHQTLFEGVCPGSIIKSPTGKDGFGYDPIFLPDGYDRTFADMTIEDKGEISHRAVAFKRLIAYLSQNV